MTIRGGGGGGRERERLLKLATVVSCTVCVLHCFCCQFFWVIFRDS